MDKYFLEAFLEHKSYCEICENIKKPDRCRGCNGIINIFDPDKNEPPTKFKSIIKEEKKMIVTIIGSFSNTEKMKECKEYWQRFGHKVNCPCDPERETMALIEKQSSWIEKIEEADLIVAIPKEVRVQEHGASNYVLNFGESTSYEMAIANHFKKPIIFS